ncbi:molybdate metabolism regulator [Listeria welshimeri]|nr:molybdate metabolism regulator [Listeria welshimeri]
MAITMYIDQPEKKLDLETTHPHFKEHFKASFYLDKTDVYAPFGYEDGLEVLRRLEEYFSDKSDQGLNLSAFPKYMMETVKKSTYVPAKDDGEERLKQLLAEFGDAALESLHREIELNRIEQTDTGHADSMFYDLLTFTKDYTSVLPDMWCRHCTE